MIFNQFSKWTFCDFVNAHFHSFVAQTREIHVFTRVRNVFWNIVSFVFHSNLGCSSHGMLILRPLAAQLSYLLIYLMNNAFFGVPGCGLLRSGLRSISSRCFTGYWGVGHRITHPSLHFPYSGAHFLDSDVHFPDSSLHSSASSPKA